MTYPISQEQKELNPGIAMRKKDQEIGPPGQAVKVKIEDLGDKIEVKEDINGVDADNIIHGIVASYR